MIKAKRPRAIIVMTTTAKKSNHKSVRLLWSSRYVATERTDITLPGVSGKVAVTRGYHPSAYLREDYAAMWLWNEEDEILAHDILRICFSKAFAVIQDEVYDDLQDRNVLDRWHEALRGIPGIHEKHEAEENSARNTEIPSSQETDLPDMTRLKIKSL
jgi:hypothetical protein